MSNPQVLRGMRDFLPEQMILRQQVIGTFREIFERHGFEPIDTPVLEYYETLTGNIDDEKLIYHFEDHGGREVGMRFDLTVPLARYAALHQNELTFPFKRYHIAPVWRADRPQRGRFREFWQCDADIVGTRSMMADADVVSIIVDALSAINMPGFVVHINHRKLLEAMARAAGVPDDQAGGIYRAIDKLDKIGPDGVMAELGGSGVKAAAAERIVKLVSTSGSPDAVLSSVREQLAGIDIAESAIDDLTQLFDYLAALGVAPERYVLNLALARGMSYYTGPVFEAHVAEANIGSLAGAGRYDGLVGRFSKQELPATGISLGLERIFEVIRELGLVQTPSTVAEVMVAVFNQDTTGPALALTTMLREAGLNVDTFLEPNRNLGRQFRYADQKGIPFAAIVGPDEVERDVVAVKDLKSGDQVEVARDEVAGYLRERLRADGTE